jgi:hypothetical protein
MSYAERMDGSFPKLDRPHTVRNGRLVETTPEVNREVTESALPVRPPCDRDEARGTDLQVLL